MHAVAFSMKPIEVDTYVVKVKFLSEQAGVLTKRKITFLRNSETPAQAATLWDVFTKNGFCTSPTSFTQKEVKEVKKALKLTPKGNPATIMVLDLKDEKSGYMCPMGSQEVDVCSFLSNEPECASKSAKKIHELLRGKLDFVLLEGTLKRDILQAGEFTQEECVFLNSDKGAPFFCQLAEYFMNGFKFGHVAYIGTKEFSGLPYIKSVSERVKSFCPFSKSTTLYPVEYQELYAVDSPFCTSLQPFFVVDGKYCEKSKLTQVTVEVKK